MVSLERDGTEGSAHAGGRSVGTIAVALAYIGDAYSNLLLPGLASYTRANSLNLAVILVDGFSGDEDAIGDYGLIDPARVDGLIVTSGLTYRNERNLSALQVFRERYPSFPMVGLSILLEQMPSVVTNGYVGMRQALEHLIDVHGYRRVAFIEGPESSLEAQARYRAYEETLADRNIPLREDLVLPGDFSEEAGIRGVQTLLQRGVEIDALVCSNDDTAMGALEVLRDRDVRVPEDLALIGFDDVEEAAQLAVPLTTVRQPIYEMGLLSAEILHRLMRGMPVEMSNVVATELIVRRSCGCLPAVVKEAALGSLEMASVQEIPGAEEIATRLGEVIEDVAPSDHRALGEALLNDLRASESDEFARAFDRLLGRLQREGYTLSLWHEALTALRRFLISQLRDSDRIRRLEDLIQQARILVGQAANRQLAHRQMIASQRVEAVQWFNGQAANLTSLSDLPSRFAYILPRLQLDACYLSTLDDSRGSARAVDEVSLATGYPNDGLEVADDGFAVHRFVPDEIWRARIASPPTVFTVLPMSIGDQDFGISVFCGQPDDFGVCFRLREAVTGIAQRVQLLEEQRAAVREAEEESRRADIALRDALVAQQRYVEQTWEEYAAPIRGYRMSPAGDGPTDSEWVSGMHEAVLDNRWIVRYEEGEQTLSLPLNLLGEEIIGVLGFSRERAVEWTEAQIRTAQVIAEQAALALENQRLISDVQRRAARLTAASEVAGAATSLTDPDELLTRVVTLIRDRFDLYYAGIFLVDEARQWAVLVAGSGEAGQLMLAQGHRLEVGGDSMIGYCVATGNARITYDAQRAERRRPHPLLPDTRSELALPLISRGEVIGAMTIQDERPGAFTEDDVTTLQTMAAQLANAITNAHLLERMERNVHELRAATGQYTQDAWRDYLQQRSATQSYRYRLVDVALAEGRRPEAQEAWREDRTVVASLEPQAELDAGPSEQVALMGESVDSDGGTGIGVPIRLRNQVLGVLNVRFEDENVPDETVRLVEQVADRLAIALESARLLAQMRRTAQRERMIGDVTDRMRRTLDWDDLMETATQELQEMLNASRVFVQWKPPKEARSIDDGAEDA